MLRVISKRGALQVVIETVDSFQGKQMDVVIMSCVRATEPGQQTGIGFVADIRRLNVAITRAKRALWILGSAATLKVCLITYPLSVYCSCNPQSMSHNLPTICILQLQPAKYVS